MVRAKRFTGSPALGRCSSGFGCLYFFLPLFDQDFVALHCFWVIPQCVGPVGPNRFGHRIVCERIGIDPRKRVGPAVGRLNQSDGNISVFGQFSSEEKTCRRKAGDSFRCGQIPFRIHRFSANI